MILYIHKLHIRPFICTCRGKGNASSGKSTINQGCALYGVNLKGGYLIVGVASLEAFMGGCKIAFFIKMVDGYGVVYRSCYLSGTQSV